MAKRNSTIATSVGAVERSLWISVRAMAGSDPERRPLLELCDIAWGLRAGTVDADARRSMAEVARRLKKNARLTAAVVPTNPWPEDSKESLGAALKEVAEKSDEGIDALADALARLLVSPCATMAGLAVPHTFGSARRAVVDRLERERGRERAARRGRGSSADVARWALQAVGVTGKESGSIVSGASRVRARRKVLTSYTG